MMPIKMMMTVCTNLKYFARWQHGNTTVIDWPNTWANTH